MKKIICFIFVIFLVGCGKKEYVTCDININNEIDNYNMSGRYIIYYDGNYVTEIKKEENYISSDEAVIEFFDESKNLEYYNLNDIYGGVTYSIKRNDNSINLTATIDMKQVDIKRMINNDYINSDYVVSNKLSLTGAKNIYESKGAKCDI